MTFHTIILQIEMFHYGYLCENITEKAILKKLIRKKKRKLTIYVPSCQIVYIFYFL